MPTTLITRLGKDELGKRASLALQDLAMDLRGLQWDEEMPTGRVGIEVEAGEARYTLHPGAWQAIRCDESARALLATCDAFCYGTLAQESEAGLASWRTAIAALPTNCLRVCDPNLRGARIDADLVYEHMQAADIVKINDEEATLMAATYKQEQLVPWLLGEMKVKMVALTHAAKGATLYTQSEEASHPGFAELAAASSSERDNIGAGDSFTAVLIRGQLAGAAPQNIVGAANRYAAFVASRRSATPEPSAPLLSELCQLLNLPSEIEAPESRS